MEHKVLNTDSTSHLASLNNIRTLFIWSPTYTAMDTKAATKPEEVATGAHEKITVAHLEAASIDPNTSEQGRQITDLTAKGK